MTDERAKQPMSEAATCGDCWHPAHPFSTCHVHTGGDPANGPNYCPCTAEMEAMEVEIRRLRSEREARGRVEAAAKPDGWHTYHICGGLLRELTFVTHGDERHAMCPVCGVWFRAALSSAEGASKSEEPGS